jgi:TM2 domain-containing membrane protein YozV
MNYEEDSISEKSQMLTLVLLLFFGSLGAHRFYVKKYFTGFIFFIIGSTSLILDFFGLKYAIISQLAYFLFMILDLYALYSDSFTDSKGKLVIGKEKILLYDTYEERDQKVFMAKLNKIMLILGALAFYILFFLIRNYIL